MHSQATFRAVLVAALLGATPAFAQGDDVSILWDDRGVPHVTASSDSGVFFGQGYASAVNGLAQMHRVRMGAQGRLAELFGSIGSNQSTFEQDMQIRRIQLYHYAGKRLNKLDAATVEALRAYSDGVNHYIDELYELAMEPGGDIAPYLSGPLEQYQAEIEAGTFEPWTPKDCLASMDWWGYWAIEGGSSDAFGEFTNGTDKPDLEVIDDLCVIEESQFQALPAAEDYYAYFHAAQPGYPAGGICDDRAVTTSKAPQFSDSWVVSGADNTGGNGAMVHAGPKLPMLNPSLFFEVRLHNDTPESGFDARGATLVGTPGLLVGFNEHVAWGAASLDADVQDLIKIEPFEQTGPPFAYGYDYVIDGVPKPYFGSYDKVYTDPQGNFEQHTFLRTKFGPVVTPLVDGAPTDDYALSSIAVKPLQRHSLVAAVRMLRATDVESFREAIKYWTVPTFECVFGESNDGVRTSGRIGFGIMTQIPTRGDNGLYPGDKPVENGGDSSQHWRRYVPHDYLPWAIESDGHLYVANHRPAGCWYPIPMHLGGAAEPTDRSLRLWQHFEQMISTQSPFYADPTTLEGFTKMAFDPVRAPMELMVTAAQVNYGSLSLLAQQAMDGPIITQGPFTLDFGFKQWLRDDARSVYRNTFGEDEELDPFARLRITTTRFAPGDTELIAAYGEGADAGLALLRDLSLVGYDPNLLDAAAQIPGFVPAVLTYIDRYVRNASYGNPWQNPVVASDPSNLAELPFFGFDSKFGGTIPSQDATKDVEFDTALASDFRFRMTFDKNTLWSTHSKVYSHDVDMSAPATSGRASHPIGNVENVDHPELGGLATVGITPLWWDGDLNPQSYYNSLEHADLADPVGAAIEKVESLTYAPGLSYYGQDYGGWDPHRAPSLELVTQGPYTAGQTIQVKVSNLPLAKDFEIDAYDAAFELEYDVTVYLDDAPTYVDLGDSIIGLVDQQSPLASATGQNQSDEVTLSLTWPVGVDTIYLHAVATLDNTQPADPGGTLHNLFPAEDKVSTMGLRVDL